MLEGARTETIAARVEVVWAIVEDLESYPLWHPFFAGVDVLRRDGEGRAAEADCRHPTPVGELTTRIRMTYRHGEEAEAVHLDGDLKSLRGGFTLRAEGERTSVTHRLAADPGFKLGLVLRGAVGDRVRDSVIAGALEGLSRRAQQSAQ